MTEQSKERESVFLRGRVQALKQGTYGWGEQATLRALQPLVRGIAWATFCQNR